MGQCSIHSASLIQGPWFSLELGLLSVLSFSPVFVWVFLGFSGFFPTPKNMHVGGFLAQNGLYMRISV